MDRRLKLDLLLRTLCNNVYFQPPETVKMTYPAIVYGLDEIQTRHADNAPFKLSRRYQITYISRNPDDEVTDKIARLSTAAFQRRFVASNLNQTVFNLYF